MKKELVIGIDIGGTFTKFAFVDRAGNTFEEGSIPTDSTDNINDFLQGLYFELDNRYERLKDTYDYKGIGVGAPNGNYLKGTIEQAPNLKWKGIVPFVDLMKKHYQVPAVLTNDANAAAIGEMIYGGAKKMKDFIVITLGTGLGSGIVVNGNLVYGHDGFAGELGHTIVKLNGRQCNCGRKGCLETYVSATGIRRTVFKLLSETVYPSELRNISFNDLTSARISEAALAGDQLALQAFDFTSQILATKLADAVAHTSPEAIFLFGGLARAGNLIFDPTREYFEKKLLAIYRGKVKILPSELTDKNAAVMGAAGLIWKELENSANSTSF